MIETEPNVDLLFREPTAGEQAQLEIDHGKLFAERAVYLARSIGLRLDIAVREMLASEKSVGQKNRV